MYLKIIPVLLLAALFVQCEKIKDLTSANVNAGAEKPTLISSCGEELKGDSILELLRDNEDKANDRINQILYHYGQALREVFKKGEHILYVENEVSADSATSGVSFITLADNSNIFKKDLNYFLKQSIKHNNIYPLNADSTIYALLGNEEWDANLYLKSKMVNLAYNYDPVVYSVNIISTTESENIPTILLAQEVDECDDVPGWKNNEEVLMSEEQVRFNDEITLFIGPGVVNAASANRIQPGNLEIFREKNAEADSRAAIDIDVEIHQIKNGHRYESNSKSEISSWYLYYSAANISSEEDITIDHWHDFRKSDRKIHKNDISISKIFDDDKNAFGISEAVFNSGVSVVHLLAYEHDWYASVKQTPISQNCFSPADVNFNSRMKYSHEFYFKACDPGSLIFLQNGTVFNVENEKCRFQFKRTN